MNLHKYFTANTKVIYPPFKNGLYLEEYFLEYSKGYNLKRKYIPALWTNFQIENWFSQKKSFMQKNLNGWVKNNPSEEYFTVVQHDDACLLKLPKNTKVYGACSGDIPIPLIYQDITNTLENIEKIKFNEKQIFCSFVGSITQNNVRPFVRQEMVNFLNGKEEYKFFITGCWTNNVDSEKQKNFIEITKNSKFALAPRGYGRSSFRFFEIFQLGTIPIYIWNDVEWLPFKDVIDYSKICISINIKDISKLDEILKNITEEDYNQMFEEYNKIKHLFTLEGMSKKIIDENI